MIATVATAWFASVGPSLFAIALSARLSLLPMFALGISAPDDGLRLLLLMICGIISALLINWAKPLGVHWNIGERQRVSRNRYCWMQ